MPRWTDTPPPEPEGLAMRIIRTPPTHTLHAIVTSPDVSGCPTHYAANRTIPCEGSDSCKWCEQGLSWRWHGYLAAILCGTLEHFLFEFTATAADTFRNYFTLHASMRACQFAARRPSGRPNGRVVIACKRLDEQRIRLPAPPNVRRILCHIWNVPYTNTDERHLPTRLGAQIGVMPGNGDGRP
jgi:hypothetical protein